MLVNQKKIYSNKILWIVVTIVIIISLIIFYTRGEKQLPHNYHHIRSYTIAPKKYLFFDIFCRDQYIFLISPVYQDHPIKYHNISISLQNTNNTSQKLSQKLYSYREYEPTVISKYRLPDRIKLDQTFSIKLNYLNHTKIYRLRNYEVQSTYLTKDKKYNLIQSTLFLYDSNLFERWYNYYLKQGTQLFIVYYNGQITPDIRKMVNNKSNIILLPWPYHYWNNTTQFRHHAQLGQMNHCLYKYAKPLSKFYINNDLDEYFWIPQQKLNRYFHTSLTPPTTDGFYFSNNWAVLKNGQVWYSPNRSLQERSKYVIRPDSVNALSIHFPKDKSVVNLQQISDSRMFHFFDWSGKKTSGDRPKDKPHTSTKLPIQLF